MLGWRVLVSAIVIPLLIAIFTLDARAGETAPWLLALTLLLAVRCCWELTQLLTIRSFRPMFSLTALCASACVGVNWFTPSLQAIGFPLAALAPLGFCYALCVLLLFLAAAIRYREPGTSIETLGSELLIVSYVGVLLGVTAQLRWVAGADAGYLALGSLVIATKCGDIGAYTLGRLFGKRKMIPRLSPGKTWMGGLGALLGSGLGSLAWFHWATPAFSPAGATVWTSPAWCWAVCYGVILGVVGLIGDLCESLIKRDVEKKDSAALMPGFGGLLDLLDSVLYAGPIAWLLWNLLPLQTWAAVNSPKLLN